MHVTQIAVGDPPLLNAARLHQNYLRCGLTERNDEIEMQKVDPDWKFEPVRW